MSRLNMAGKIGPAAPLSGKAGDPDTSGHAKPLEVVAVLATQARQIESPQ